MSALARLLGLDTEPPPRPSFTPLGDDKALLRVLVATALDLAESAGADQVKVADMRRLLRAIP